MNRNDSGNSSHRVGLGPRSPLEHPGNPDHRALGVVVDPAHDSRPLNVVTSDCRLLRRSAVNTPLDFVAVWGDRVVATRTLDLPGVIAYRVQVTPR
jgi:hypothetical protein